MSSSTGATLSSRTSNLRPLSGAHRPPLSQPQRHQGDLDDFSYLTEEAREMIQGFWGDLPSLQSISEDDDKGYKKRFLSFWECLCPAI